jgi:hypothetical protein
MCSATRRGRRDVVRDQRERGQRAAGALALAHRLRVDLLDQLSQEGGSDRVQAGIGLVEEHDVRIEDECACEAALAHAARELIGELVARSVEADLTQALQRDLGDLVLALVGVLAQREGDVVEHRHRPEEGPVLEEHAELAAHPEQLVVGHRRHRLAVDEDVTLVGIEQADHVLDADALPGARRAEDHGDLALGQAEIEAAQDPIVPEGLVDFDELDGIRHGRWADPAGVPAVLVGVGLFDRQGASLGVGMNARLRESWTTGYTFYGGIGHVRVDWSLRSLT